ncbi:MAG: M20 family metallopeptidase [Eubacteriaceae bacterium]|nr:M20 family metallopeptidase [Eubacteriaceae bacterium]
MEEERKALEDFLSCDISRSDEVFERFASLGGAYEAAGVGKQRFLYIPGKRRDKIVLAAHADTAWDKSYRGEVLSQKLTLSGEGYYKGTNPLCGIGADDRAGCAMLYLLRESGHSLLILDGEEMGMIGSKYLRDSHRELFEEINDHNMIIQLDRRNDRDYKCYSIPVSGRFRAFIEEKTGYKDAGNTAATDIVALCERVCGVNFSVGYYNEHTPEESLCYEHWLNTLNMVRNLIAPGIERYPTEAVSTE